MVLLLQLTQIAKTPRGSSLASPALTPVGLQLGGLVGIFQCLLEIRLGRVDSRTVRVEDVITALDGNGLGEFITGSLAASITSLFPGGDIASIHSGCVVFGRKGLVAFSFESVRHVFSAGVTGD